MDKSLAVRALIILVAAFVLFALIAMYRSSRMTNERFSLSQHPLSSTAAPYEAGGGDANSTSSYDDDQMWQQQASTAGGSPYMESVTGTTTTPNKRAQEGFAGYASYNSTPSARPLQAQAVVGGARGTSAGDVEPSEPLSNEQYRAVDYDPAAAAAVAHAGPPLFGGKQLTSEDLLPKDAANSKWAQMTPSGQGELCNLNFTNSGWHIGVNTKGQSLRNANLQLRSDPITPQFKVSPWMMSTIEPDVSRRAFEIM